MKHKVSAVSISAPGGVTQLRMQEKKAHHERKHDLMKSQLSHRSDESHSSYSDSAEILNVKYLQQQKSAEVEALKQKAHAAEVAATHRLERKGNKIKIVAAKGDHDKGIGSDSELDRKLQVDVSGSIQNHQRQHNWSSRLMRAAKPTGALAQTSVESRHTPGTQPLGLRSGSWAPLPDPNIDGCDDFSGYYVTGANETLNLAQKGCDVEILIQNHSLHLDQTESNGTGQIVGRDILVLPGHGINGTTPNATKIPDPDLHEFGHVLIEWNNGDVWTRKACNDFGGIYWDGDTRFHIIQNQCHAKIYNTRDMTQPPFDVNMTGNDITISRWENASRLVAFHNGTGHWDTKVGHLGEDLLTIKFDTGVVWLRNSSVEQPDDHIDAGISVDVPDPHYAAKVALGEASR